VTKNGGVALNLWMKNNLGRVHLFERFVHVKKKKSGPDWGPWEESAFPGFEGDIRG